ncbi:hypothetical protein ACEWY4_023897 [Coilia grayii]|uniref:ribonuclease H n=1 Tax=Coilia grayii TaxID=363190 RepID=A0ABD1IYT6_9TELE
MGVDTVNFTCGTLQFHIVNGDMKPLLGLTDSVKLGFVKLGPTVHALQQEVPELTEYKDLFDCSTIGKLPVVYRMCLDDSVHPTICSPKRVPLAMKDKTIEELYRMTKLGVIKPVQGPSEWVSAMVAAVKKDGSIRICIDPVHLNKALLRPHHPMKTVEQVISDMPGAKVFSILDAKCGFWQVPLSQKLTTFITPAGRYAFLRMPYGISTGSEVFQRCMEQLFEGQPCAIVVDDILVWGSTTEEHDMRHRQVMDRIRAVNLKLNPDKCRHLLTDQGIKPDPTKTAAVRLMTPPEDKHGIQRFLGMTNYLSKFIPGYSEITAALRQLLLQDAEWSWQEHHATAFNKLKELLMTRPVLQYFNVHQPVVLSADASQHGLGTVCLQNNKPVAFASRALTETETHYAQIEKELLALVYACQKFHDYIYGRPVTVHQIIRQIISPSSPYCGSHYTQHLHAYKG